MLQQLAESQNVDIFLFLLKTSSSQAAVVQYCKDSLKGKTQGKNYPYRFTEEVQQQSDHMMFEIPLCHIC